MSNDDFEKNATTNGGENNQIDRRGSIQGKRVSRDEQPVDIQAERMLQKAVDQLRQEAPMKNDVWPSIEAAIRNDTTENVWEHRRYRGSNATKAFARGWLPIAVAASLLVSIGSLVLTWQNLEKAEALYARIDDAKERTIAAEYSDVDPSVEDVMRQVAQLESTYRQAKKRLMTQIMSADSSLTQNQLLDIQSRFASIDDTTALLVDAIKRQPSNGQLHKLLQATYQKELVSLAQVVRLNGSI